MGRPSQRAVHAVADPPPLLTDRLLRRLDSPRVPLAAAALALLLGLVFAFVRAPHPWDWRGIDEYHDLAVALARHGTFETLDRPWGYAGFVAAFYALFGERPWIPVTAQVIANAAIPLLLYRLVCALDVPRTAALAALLAGAFSFNTVYASILASDAPCTVIVMAALLFFVRGLQSSGTAAFAASGLLLGLAAQFRPNLLLLPLVLAGASALRGWRAPGRAAGAAVLVGTAALALAPWTIRNYALTGLFLPTSTRGAIQLWYGSLQVGPYLENRTRNPRSALETPVFDYTTLAGRPMLVTVDAAGCGSEAGHLALRYWTDRAPDPALATPSAVRGSRVEFTLPGQPIPTAVYYQLAVDGHDAGPPGVFFVSDDHLGDMDRHGDLLDVFDVIRLVRHVAWEEPLADAPSLDLDGDGAIGPADIELAVTLLVGGHPPVEGLDSHPRAAQIVFADGSHVRVPRAFGGRLSEIEVEEGAARRLLHARRSLAADTWASDGGTCPPGTAAAINDVFHAREIDAMRRHVALARDNIAREPLAFAAAAAYRAVRLFIVRGTADPSAAYQFEGSRLVYGAATIASAALFALCLAGVALAWRRRAPLLWLALPIAYVPATIAILLTNQRYTLTVQPLMFAFAAAALLALAARPRPVAAAVPAGAGGRSPTRRGGKS